MSGDPERGPYKCDDCDGTGMIDGAPCPVCRGEGVVDDDD